MTIELSANQLPTRTEGSIHPTKAILGGTESGTDFAKVLSLLDLETAPSDELADIEPDTEAPDQLLPEQEVEDKLALEEPADLPKIVTPVPTPEEPETTELGLPSVTMEVDDAKIDPSVSLGASKEPTELPKSQPMTVASGLAVASSIDRSPPPVETTKTARAAGAPKRASADQLFTVPTAQTRSTVATLELAQRRNIARPDASPRKERADVTAEPEADPVALPDSLRDLPRGLTAPSPEQPLRQIAPVITLAAARADMQSDSAALSVEPESVALHPTAHAPTHHGFAPGQSVSVVATEHGSRTMADQMAAIASRQSDGTTEIRLSPAELGSVRMTLTTTDTSLQIVILAERPETLDLMRRHGEQLLDAFREAGFGHASLDFAGQSDGQPTDDAPPETIATQETSIPSELPQTAAEVTTYLVAQDALDLRL